jgi:hypothetical protein
MQNSWGRTYSSTCSDEKVKQRVHACRGRRQPCAAGITRYDEEWAAGEIKKFTEAATLL